MSTVDTTNTATAPAPLPVLNSVGQAFVVLYRNLPAALLVTAPVLIAWLPAALVPAWRTPGDDLNSRVIFGILATLGTVATLLASMALQQATLRYLKDGTFPVAAAYRDSLGRLAPYFVLTLLFMMMCILSATMLIVPFLIVAPMFYLAPTVWLAERCSIPAAFRRSAELTRGNRLRILAITVAATAISLLTDRLLGMPKAMMDVLYTAGGSFSMAALSVAQGMIAAALFAILYARLAERRPAVVSPA